MQSTNQKQEAEKKKAEKKKREAAVRLPPSEWPSPQYFQMVEAVTGIKPDPKHVAEMYQRAEEKQEAIKAKKAKRFDIFVDQLDDKEMEEEKKE